MVFRRDRVSSAPHKFNGASGSLASRVGVKKVRPNTHPGYTWLAEKLTPYNSESAILTSSTETRQPRGAPPRPGHRSTGRRHETQSPAPCRSPTKCPAEGGARLECRGAGESVQR